MFQVETRKSTGRSALAMLELIFHATVRNVRKSHGNALVGLLLNILQTVILIAVFFFMLDLLGMRGNAIRGDFLLYVMSGVIMFMTHSKALLAVSNAEGPTSTMMKHAPMNTIVSICAAAFAALYTQFLSVAVVLYFYHAIFTPITLHEPVGVMGMFLLSWGTGAAIGMIFLAARPWQPDAVSILSSLYARANMIASGKMIVANATPTYILGFFDWNPLFHTIDQGRGFIFLNYNPHYSSIDYPIKVMIACMVIGLMAEFYTRKYVSLSWGAKR